MQKEYRNISIDKFTYELPDNRIALYPMQERDNSNLLVYKDGNISKTIFHQITDHLAASSVMVFNNTRVVQARLLFQKSSGAHIEIFCLEPSGKNHDIQLAFQEKGQSTWFCLVGNARRWKGGTLEMNAGENIILKAALEERSNDGYRIGFSWNSDISFAEVLELAGKTPLPPYLGRKAEEADKKRYQTIFARHSGSVAAPTAGLHFTDKVMDTLGQKKITKAFLTLHVGAGTFKPVSSPTIASHQMHHEQVIIPATTVRALAGAGNVICVGTTSLRTLESIFWLGVKLRNGYMFGTDGFHIHQWEPYETPAEQVCTTKEAFEAVITYMDNHKLEAVHGETSLIIIPGYKIRTVNQLITNFHQPGSTLLLLVAAFCGQHWKDIYNFALDNEFRFLSYGDSCLLYRNDSQHEELHSK
jgi:S-adenosylmethionine:tRNA ribosyltransferase-isomerase